MIRATTILLLAGAIALVAFPRSIHYVTSKSPTPRLTAPDELPRAGREDPTSFLIERNTVEVETLAPMTVRQFLDLYRLQRPDLRKQVLDQLGNPPLDGTIAAGTRLKIVLTPTAADVPGTAN